MKKSVEEWRQYIKDEVYTMRLMASANEAQHRLTSITLHYYNRCDRNNCYICKEVNLYTHAN